eukprot:4033266-Amphidinium_carterae.3
MSLPASYKVADVWQESDAEKPGLKYERSVTVVCSRTTDLGQGKQHQASKPFKILVWICASASSERELPKFSRR